MRRSLVLVLATLMALAVLAPAAGSDDRRGREHDKSFTLYATEYSNITITREGEVSENEEEFAPDLGDRFVVLETVYDDAERTDEVGRNHIECTITHVAGEFPEAEPAEGVEPPFFEVEFVCSGVLDLQDRGTLSWSGVTGFSSDDFTEESSEEPFIVLAITGGTGDLVGASGEVTIFDDPTGSEEETLSRYEVSLLHGSHARRGR